MKKGTRVFAVLVALSFSLSFITACSSSSEPHSGGDSVRVPASEVYAACLVPYTGAASHLSEDEQRLYNDTVIALLEQELWTSRDAYDASHYLMVPMFYAFRSGESSLIEAYARFFARFAEEVGSGTSAFTSIGDLDKLQFHFFATQFMVLCALHGRQELVPAVLPELSQRCAEYVLYDVPSNWGVEPSYEYHIQTVLSGKQYSRQYYSMIDDFTLFSLGILCGPHIYHSESNLPVSRTEEQAREDAYQLFASPLLNTTTADDGWLFQVGVCSDYGDFAYAGNPSITEGIEPCVKEDIVADSSHFHRMPLLLATFGLAQTEYERQALFLQRRAQLSNQLINHVLQEVDGHWLTTTFMDGTNGVYRYSYNTEGVGLEGYALSGTFLMGWWSLLADDRVSEVYRDILPTFPMAGDRSNPYYDYATTRERNPFFDASSAFDTGMLECTVLCAARLGE